jgi:hypothetical protein
MSKHKHEQREIEELLRQARETSRLLHQIVRLLKGHGHPRLNLTIGDSTMPQTITNSKTASITARIAPTDAAGKPASIDPAGISWGCSDHLALSLTPSDDGLSCLIKPLGPVTDPANPPTITVAAAGFTGESDTVAVIDAGSAPPPTQGKLNLTFDAPVA